MRNNLHYKRLGDLCEVIAGQSPEGKFYNTEGKGMPFYQGKKDFGEKFIEAPKTWTTQITKIARDGDILMSVRAPVGPINFATNESCIGRGLAAIRNKFELNRDFLFYQLLHLQPQISGREGAVFASINKFEIESLYIFFTSLSEQQRIVKVLDEAFDGIAIAKANAEKNLKNARAIFEIHLNVIFSQYNEEWLENRLEKLTTKIGSGATPLGGEEAYQLEGISLIRSLNVHDVGLRYERLAFINEMQATKLSNVEVQESDVLLNITGASIARCCIVPARVLPARVNQHVSIIRPISDQLVSEFLHYLLISKHYKDRLLQTGEDGGSTRQALTKAQIQDFKICYPKSLEDQRSIVTKLDFLAIEICQLETIYQRKIIALNELKKSLLQQAFTGNLKGSP
jgi:type I restriction enzyme, S subunit